jgi:acetyl esterase/lipase
MMRLVFFAFAAMIALPVSAQAPPQTYAPPVEVKAPDQKAAIPLLPPNLKAAPEQWEAQMPGDLSVRNVVNPTLMPFLPDPKKATGVAVIVAPGGAFRLLAYQHEGTMVAKWLADHGIAAFVLKYRLVPTPRDSKGFFMAMGEFMKTAVTSPKLETPPEPLADAQAAVRMVRARAKEWHIDPARVGFVGFSAGAMTTISVGLAPELDARPNFIAPIYPPMMARDVSADAPPMFLAIALDDPLFATGKSLGLIDSWRTAKRPVEAHLYEKGSHGFGMSNRSEGSALWIDEFYAWMKDRGVIKLKK